MPADKISFQCPHCHRRVSVSEAHRGKQGKCPGCGTAITIPEGTLAPGNPEEPVSPAEPPKSSDPAIDWLTVRSAQALMIAGVCLIALCAFVSVAGFAAFAIEGKASNTLIGLASLFCGAAAGGGMYWLFYRTPWGLRTRQHLDLARQYSAARQKEREAHDKEWTTPLKVIVEYNLVARGARTEQQLRETLAKKIKCDKCRLVYVAVQGAVEVERGGNRIIEEHILEYHETVPGIRCPGCGKLEKSTML